MLSSLPPTDRMSTADRVSATTRVSRVSSVSLYTAATTSHDTTAAAVALLAIGGCAGVADSGVR